MIRFSVYYPAGEGARFDHAYYETTHRDLILQRLAAFGLIKVELDRGLAGMGDAAAPYVACAHLYFHAVEEIQAGLGTHGPEILGDIPNYTNIQPVVQIARIAVDQKVERISATPIPAV